MSEFFLTVVNMSIAASWIVLAVLVLRLLLKKAPKWITVALWGIVAVRLVCPFAFESALSLIPSAETISPDIMMDSSPEINTGITAINSAVNPVISESFSPDPAASANPLQILIPVLSVVWLVGIAAMLVYTGLSYWRIKRKVATAVLCRENIYQSENVVSPFVLGIVKPKIYLPFKMSEKDMEHVIAHEKAHISRKDHLWKPLGFLLLALHWFNPLMWLGYTLLCRDIELACDEKVVREMNTEQRADYSQALLTCSVNRRMISACPLAFGEVGVKKRVKSVLNYKKPVFWIIAVAAVAGVAAAVCFLTNPAPEKIMLDIPFNVDDVRNVVMTRYVGTVAVEHKDVTETEDINHLCALFTELKVSNQKSDELTGGNALSFRFHLSDDTSYEIVYSAEAVKKGRVTIPAEQLDYFTSADIESCWYNLEYEVVSETEAVFFHNKLINKSNLSQETIEWLERYNRLTEEEQLMISFVPPDLLKQIYADKTGGVDVPAETIANVDGEPLETAN